MDTLRRIIAYMRSSTFVKIIAGFLAVLGIAILTIGMVSYSISRTALLRNAIDSSRMNAASIMEQVDVEITSLHYTVLGILTGEDLANFEYFEKTGTPDSLFRARDMSKYIGHLQAINPTLRQILLYSLRTQTVLSASGSFAAEEYFEKRVRFTTVSGQDFCTAINEPQTYSFQYLCTVAVEDPNYSSTCLAFVRSVASHQETPDGQILLLVDASVFDSILAKATQQRMQTVLLLDSTGEVISSTANAQHDLDAYVQVLPEVLADEVGGGISTVEIGGTRYSGFVARSGANDLQCMVLIEDAVLFADINYIRVITFVGLAICLCVSVFITYAMTRRIYAPIQSILLYIKAEQSGQERGAEGYRDVYLIEEFLAYMKTQNTHLQERIDSYHRIMQDTMLTELLYAFDPQRALAVLEGQDVSGLFPYPYFTVATIPLAVPESGFALVEETASAELERLLRAEPYASGLRVHVLKQYDRMVLVINARREAAAADFLKALKAGYVKAGAGELLCGYGKTYDHVEGIHDSFHQAMNVLAVKTAGAPRVADRYLQPLDAQYVTSSYTKEQEIRLISLVKSGNSRAAVLDMVEALMRENGGQEDATSLRVESLMVQLIMTINRVIAEMNVSQESIFGPELNHYRSLDRYPTLAEKEHYLLGAFEALLAYVQETKTNKSASLYQQMLAYVEAHYASSEISLNQISYEMNLSASYLSNIFKEYHQGNFLDYLNTYRVGQAKRLLVETELPIAAIAERVGCANANTFIRIFKKAEGMTPGQYRTLKR